VDPGFRRGSARVACSREQRCFFLDLKDKVTVRKIGKSSHQEPSRMPWARDDAESGPPGLYDGACRKRSKAPAIEHDHPSRGLAMKKIEITDFGAPEAVARCVEAPDVGMPDAG
jgi:hypothetical protein